MTVQETIQTLERASVYDRIHVIEELLQSLKRDLAQPAQVERAHSFRVMTFDLQSDVTVDRDLLYAERGM